MPTDSDIRQAAQALIDRHGSAAAEHARLRAEELGRSGDLRGQDAAWRVLSAVEALLSAPGGQP